MMSDNKITAIHKVDEIEDGQRIDKVLSSKLKQYSRNKIQHWIEEGCVQLDGVTITQKTTKVFYNQELKINATIEATITDVAENIQLDKIYEDEHILIINKPNKMVVHPGAGNSKHTILNALLYHYPEINQVPRAGIVHRLDKNTTGLMVIAKTLAAQFQLVKDISARNIIRNYKAIVYGQIISGGTIHTHMERSKHHRTKMAVTQTAGKEAITHYRVLKKFRAHTYLSLKLETGRTHQIRAHMQHIGHPIVGDQVYCNKPRFNKNAAVELNNCIKQFNRQALHAYALQLQHPVTGKTISCKQEIPDDMKNLMELLELDQNHQTNTHDH